MCDTDLETSLRKKCLFAICQIQFEKLTAQINRFKDNNLSV